MWAMMHASLDALRERAQTMAEAVQGGAADLDIVACKDPIGGGSHPGEVLDGLALAIRPHHGSATGLCTRLRDGATPLVAVIADDRVLFHLRTIAPEDDQRVGKLLLDALAA